MALDPIDLTAPQALPESEDELPLVLSTIHSAKGLEFSVVFLIQALDGVMPSSYSVGSDDTLDEELRLIYVAVTRAADMRVNISRIRAAFWRTSRNGFWNRVRWSRLIPISVQLYRTGP